MEQNGRKKQPRKVTPFEILRNLMAVISDYCSYWTSLTWCEDVAVKGLCRTRSCCEAHFSGGLSVLIPNDAKKRHRGMINVIARAIARLIDGWPLLIKRLWQIMYFSSQGERKKKCKSKVETGGKQPDALQYWLCHLWCVWLQRYNYFELF